MQRIRAVACRRLLSAMAVALATTLLASVAWAQTGYLHLRERPAPRPNGVQPSGLYVFDSEGNAISGAGGSGAFAAGSYAEVAPGSYYVMVGTSRAPSTVRRIEVEEGKVSVVPSGWVSILTVPREEQGTRGCQRWSGTLTAYALVEDGPNELVSSNLQASAEDFGMLQLGAGVYEVHFNGMPVRVDIVADQELMLPLGYVDPVQGRNPQLAPASARDSEARANLCEDAALHVPAGQYRISVSVPIDQPPFERREWSPLTVEPADTHGYTAVQLPRLAHPVSSHTAQPLTSADASALMRIRGGESGGPRLRGFGR